MSVREREGLIARIRQLRRSAGRSEEPSGAGMVHLEAEAIRALEDRVAHLEQLVQGLQDSVHRESQRHDKRIAELETRLAPAALNKALSREARERGL
jgi:hypothetical protein